MGGTVSLLAGTEIGNTAKFTCNAGFQRSGSESLTCGVNGEWSDTPPICVSVGRLEDSQTGRQMSRVMRKPMFWFSTRSDTNWAVQSQKVARCLKFRI